MYVNSLNSLAVRVLYIVSRTGFLHLAPESVGRLVDRDKNHSLSFFSIIWRGETAAGFPEKKFEPLFALGPPLVPPSFPTLTPGRG